MSRLLEICLLPPMLCLLLAGLGFLLRRRARRTAHVLWVAAFLLLWLASSPWVGSRLLGALQTAPAYRPGRAGSAEAIVVLSGDHLGEAPEFGGPTVGAFTLQRIRYAAALQRATGLPLLVSGGVPELGVAPHAELMRAVLEQELEAEVRWLETRSGNTLENARYSAAVLRPTGVQRVLLVTHAWHMPRAADAFEHFGLEVVPAPTAFTRAATGPMGWLPHWTGLRDTCLALHEILGRIYYELFRL